MNHLLCLIGAFDIEQRHTGEGNFSHAFLERRRPANDHSARDGLNKRHVQSIGQGVATEVDYVGSPLWRRGQLTVAER